MSVVNLKVNKVAYSPSFSTFKLSEKVINLIKEKCKDENIPILENNEHNLKYMSHDSKNRNHKFLIEALEEVEEKDKKNIKIIDIPYEYINCYTITI